MPSRDRIEVDFDLDTFYRFLDGIVGGPTTLTLPDGLDRRPVEYLGWSADAESRTATVFYRFPEGTHV